MSHRIDYAKASPEGYKAFGGVYAYIQKCGLPKELIDLVYLRVSQINGCAYCIDMHSRDLLKSGVAVDKLVLVPVWRDAGSVVQRPRTRRAGLGGDRHPRRRNRRSGCRLRRRRRRIQRQGTRRSDLCDRSDECLQPPGVAFRSTPAAWLP